MNAETRNCQNCKKPFVIEPEDFGFYQKMQVPPPTWCPECRFRRRSLFRNERVLYRRKCSACHKDTISFYNPRSDFVIYCLDCYDSDAWDPFSYGQAYDPARPFFAQFQELMRKVPKQALYVNGGKSNANSEYTNYAGPNKNAYLVFNTGDSEDVAYSRGLKGCKNTQDAYFGSSLENCYETVNCQQSSGVLFGQNCVSCLNCVFMLNSSGCTDCFGCVNLRNKTNCFFNEQLTKEEYEKRVGEIMGSYEKIREYAKKFDEFSLRFPRRENNNLKAVQSEGNYLFQSKNLKYCFEVAGSENCKFCHFNKDVKDSYDAMAFGWGSELLLETVAVGYSNRVIGSANLTQCHDAMYSFALRNSGFCFGCDGLRSGEHCILNKKYDEREYASIVEKIVAELKSSGEYGMFFPPELGLCAYNESIGQDNLPLAKEESLSMGFGWQDDIFETRGKETLRPDEIPDHIKQVPDSITNEVLACIECEKNYKIAPTELSFYVRMNLPIPRKCFNCRHTARIEKRGPFKFFDRTCARCGKHIRTSYAPDRPEIVYCETCYQLETI